MNDVLHVTIEIETPVATLAPNARVPGTAEGGGKIANEETIDPSRSRDERSPDARGFALVARKQCRSEAVFRIVREANRFFFVAKRLNRQNRAEDFLLEDLRVFGHTRKQRGFVVQPAMIR